MTADESRARQQILARDRIRRAQACVPPPDPAPDPDEPTPVVASIEQPEEDR
jgi:hypothetical protein